MTDLNVNINSQSSAYIDNTSIDTTSSPKTSQPVGDVLTTGEGTGLNINYSGKTDLTPTLPELPKGGSTSTPSPDGSTAEIANNGNEVLSQVSTEEPPGTDAAPGTPQPTALQALSIVNFMSTIGTSLQALRLGLNESEVANLLLNKDRTTAYLTALSLAPATTSLLALREQLTYLKENGLENAGKGRQRVLLLKHPEVAMQLVQLGIVPPHAGGGRYDNKAADLINGKPVAGIDPATAALYKDPVVAATVSQLPAGWEELSAGEIDKMIAQIDTKIALIGTTSLVMSTFSSSLASSGLALGMAAFLSGDINLASMLMARAQISILIREGLQSPALLLMKNSQLTAALKAATGLGVLSNLQSVSIGQLANAINQLDIAILAHTAAKSPLNMAASMLLTTSLFDAVQMNAAKLLMTSFSPTVAILNIIVRQQIVNLFSPSNLLFSDLSRADDFSKLTTGILATQVFAAAIAYSNLASISREDGLTFNSMLVQAFVRDRMATFIAANMAQNILTNSYENFAKLPDFVQNALINVATGFALNANVMLALGFKGDLDTVKELVQIMGATATLSPYLAAAQLLLQADPLTTDLVLTLFDPSVANLLMQDPLQQLATIAALGNLFKETLMQLATQSNDLQTAFAALGALIGKGSGPQSISTSLAI